MRPSGLKIAAILALGILAISFGSILVRLALAASGDKSLAFSLLMSAGRMGLAALLLAPGWRTPLGNRAGLPYALAAGAFLALHFAFWITSLSYTSVAASTALVTTNPVWITLFGWLLFKEVPSGLTLLGVGVALLGGLLIGLGDAQGGSGTNPLLGDLLALLGAVAASLYFLLGREAQRRGLSILEYVRVAYTAAALVLLPLPYLFGGGYGGYPLAVYGYILLMALLPQLLGHTSFNWATRHIPPVLVTLAILFEPVGASLLAFLLFGELPGVQVLLGALVLLIGVGMAVVGGTAMIHVALAALLWGLGGALAGRFMGEIPPSVLIPLRFLLSFFLLLPLVLRFPPATKEWPRLLRVGLALSGAQAFYYLAIHATTVATGIFLQYLAPALLTLYALLRGEKLPGKALLGVTVALLGAYVLVGPKGFTANPVGVAYGLLSALSFALYAAFSHGLKTPPLVSLGVATGVGSLLSLPLLLLHLPQVLALSPANWGAVVYLVVLGTVVPFGLFLLGVRTLPARQATLVAMLEPVAGAVFAWPLAGQPLTPWALLGGTLILLGVALNRR